MRIRLQKHSSFSHNCPVETLKARYGGGLIATHVALRGLGADWLRPIEDASLQVFRQRFGRYPVCNMAAIDSGLVDQLADLVRFTPCEGLPFPLSLQTLSSQLKSNVDSLGRFPDRLPEEAYKARSRSFSEVTIVFTSALKEGDSLVVTPPIEIDPQAQLDNLSTIWAEHVAAWSDGKMRSVVELCGRLSVPKERNRSKVHTFVAPDGKVPRPLTWGEVALIQGRKVAGCWFPSSRVWLKIVCGKKLLGQAILDSVLYRGEDKSDLPQARRRPSIWEGKKWLAEYEAVTGELPASFMPVQLPIAEVPDVQPSDPDVAEHIRLLQASRAFDLAEARRHADWDRKMAIEDDKYRKASKLLQARIEASYIRATNALV